MPGAVFLWHLLMKPVNARSLVMTSFTPGGDGDESTVTDSGESADGTFASCKYLAEKHQYCKV